MGAIGYADDCMLLSPTISSMTHQLKICENYSKEYNVSFNVEKYQPLHCAKSSNHIDGITYNGIYILNILMLLIVLVVRYLVLFHLIKILTLLVLTFLLM